MSAKTRSRISPHRLEVDVAVSISESDQLILGRLSAAVAAELAGAGTKPSPFRLVVVPSRRGEGDATTARVLIHRELGRGASPVQVSADEIANRTVTTREFAREGLAWLDPQARAGALEFIIAATSGRRAQNRRARFAIDREVRISHALHELREALRERLPVTISDSGPIGLIDSVAKVDHGAFFMRGRIRLGSSRLVRVTAVSPEGRRIEVLDHAYWYEIANPSDEPGVSAWRGFAIFFDGAPSHARSGWLVELETLSGEMLEVGCPAVATQAADVVRVILEDLAVEPLPATKLRVTQVLPAVRRLQRARRRNAKLEAVKQFGVAPSTPVVSVVVPLYRRIDLIEHQMAQFGDDPGMRAVDLIYVLDSPELKDELMGAARRLFPLYRQPFRVAVVSTNVGFAGANNLGASIARGRLLLLLNSDVFPESPGWVEEMVRFHDSLPNAGAIGPKLLYEDDTIQHAGMYFERLSDTLPWSNEHHFKGMHRDVAAATRSRRVAAVTGACLMVDRNLYQQHGGLSGDYIQGDFEDSELCLRLLQAGRQNWYFAGIALYHLEASSYIPEQRRVHDAFNRWLHSHLWAEQLNALGGSGRPHIAAAPPRIVKADGVNGEVTAAVPALS